jgi:hypothetical protein
LYHLLQVNYTPAHDQIDDQIQRAGYFLLRFFLLSADESVAAKSEKHLQLV